MPGVSRPQKRSGLGLPIGEDAHYIVRVFYGGKYCDESLEGPFRTLEEAAAMAKGEWSKGHGTLVLRCVNVTALAMGTPAWGLR